MRVSDIFMRRETVRHRGKTVWAGDKRTWRETSEDTEHAVICPCLCSLQNYVEINLRGGIAEQVAMLFVILGPPC